MELPIKLRFFKRIDLYQEYKYQEHKLRTSGTRLKCWRAEKEILKWTASGHHHLASQIDSQPIKERILDNQYVEYRQAIANLIQRGYAVDASDNGQPGIKMTDEGMLMGQVISEVEGKHLYWHQLQYTFFFALAWSTVIAGALIVLLNFLKFLYQLLVPFLFWILDHVSIRIS